MSFNEDVRDDMLASASALAHFENLTLKDVLKDYQGIWGRLEKEAQKKLPEYKRARIKAMEKSVRRVVDAANKQADRTLQTRLKDVVDITDTFMSKALNGNVPKNDPLSFKFDVLSPEEILAVYDPKRRIPFAKLGDAQVIATQKSIAESAARGEGAKEAARRLRTSVEGLTKDRAEMIARTELQEASGKIQRAYLDKNKEFMQGVQYSCALDDRTCLVCGPKDGTVWSSVNEVPDDAKPPVHPRCRCVLIPVAKGLDDIFPELQGLTAPSQAMRASFDGEVPASLKWGDWLAKMDKKASVNVAGTSMSGDDYVRGILGSTRYVMWKAGKIDVGNFSTGKRITPVSKLLKKVNKLPPPDPTKIIGKPTKAPKLKAPKAPKAKTSPADKPIPMKLPKPLTPLPPASATVRAFMTQRELPVDPGLGRNLRRNSSPVTRSHMVEIAVDHAQKNGMRKTRNTEVEWIDDSIAWKKTGKSPAVLGFATNKQGIKFGPQMAKDAPLALMRLGTAGKLNAEDADILHMTLGVAFHEVNHQHGSYRRGYYEKANFTFEEGLTEGLARLFMHDFLVRKHPLQYVGSTAEDVVVARATSKLGGALYPVQTGLVNGLMGIVAEGMGITLTIKQRVNFLVAWKNFEDATGNADGKVRMQWIKERIAESYAGRIKPRQLRTFMKEVRKKANYARWRKEDLFDARAEFQKALRS